jgi:hypothetical protein
MEPKCQDLSAIYVKPDVQISRMTRDLRRERQL